MTLTGYDQAVGRGGHGGLPVRAQCRLVCVPHNWLDESGGRVEEGGVTQFSHVGEFQHSIHLCFVAPAEDNSGGPHSIHYRRLAHLLRRHPLLACALAPCTSLKGRNIMNTFQRSPVTVKKPQSITSALDTYSGKLLADKGETFPPFHPPPPHRRWRSSPVGALGFTLTSSNVSPGGGGGSGGGALFFVVTSSNVSPGGGGGGGSGVGALGFTVTSPNVSPYGGGGALDFHRGREPRRIVVPPLTLSSRVQPLTLSSQVPPKTLSSRVPPLTLPDAVLPCPTPDAVLPCPAPDGVLPGPTQDTVLPSPTQDTVLPSPTPDAVLPNHTPDTVLAHPTPDVVLASPTVLGFTKYLVCLNSTYRMHYM